MSFNRQPRIQTYLPETTVEVPAPPTLPAQPTAMNWLSIGLPIGAVLLSVVLMSGGGGASGASYMRFLPIMLATYLASGVSYIIGRRAHGKKLSEAKTSYQQSLQDVEDQLRGLETEQRKALLCNDPNSSECLRRAQHKDARLGERRPRDDDFLNIRLGLGSVQTKVRIVTPDLKAPPQEFKDLAKRAGDILKTYALVTNAPVATSLPSIGSIGIVGRRQDTRGLVRAMIGQIATHHWADEVRIAVISPNDDRAWQWLVGLPHSTKFIGKPTGENGSEEEWLSKALDAVESELQTREQWLAVENKGENGQINGSPPLPRIVIILDALPEYFCHPGLMLLLERGKDLGVYSLFLKRHMQDVPGKCRAVVQTQRDQLTLREAGVEGNMIKCRPDLLDENRAKTLVQALADIKWPNAEDLSQPPALVTLLELFGVSSIEELPIEKWWDSGSPYGYLRAPIGRVSASADMIFDLNDCDGSHGPHGLIGGMTGSGKSEVLKTILLAMAMTHNPNDLNFALIDFKGGATFNELAKLPHTVGVVTDIESHATFAERVIEALSGEIEHRKRVLDYARRAFGFGRSHVDEYRQLIVKRPLPRLVIVFDEFAEFKQSYPVQSKRLISIARQGRSLGVHLILATQNIGAAVDPEILQNSSFRICLRVSEPQDSVQMIGIPDAIKLTRGRAYFKAEARQLLQVAYGGGVYQHSEEGEEGAQQQVIRVWPDGRRERLALARQLAPKDEESTRGQANMTECQAVVERMVKAARKLRLKKPPSVWPDPLPSRLYVQDLLGKYFTGGWDGEHWNPCQPWAAGDQDDSRGYAVLGLYDYPAEQKQVVFQIDSNSGGGHLLIFGSAGTGKSTLLRALTLSLVLTSHPDQVHIYALDFGGQSTLKVLEGFPHVGSVVTRFETERVERLIRFIHQEVSRRNNLFRERQVDNWIAYNLHVNAKDHLPAIYLLIDGFGNLKRTFPPEIVKSISALISGGAASGLYLVVSSSLQADIPNDIFANVHLRMTFHQADQTEYYRIVGRPSEIKLQEEVGSTPPPGRGLLRGSPPLAFQAALPIEGDSDKEQVENMTALAERMCKFWKGPFPPEIRDLPLLFPLPGPDETRLLFPDKAPLSFRIVVGQDYKTLAPIDLSLIRDGPTFLVAAVSPQAGKTTVIRTCLLGLVGRYAASEFKLFLVDFHCRSLMAFRRLPHTYDYVGSKTTLEPALSHLAMEVKRRRDAMEEVYEANPDSFDSRQLISSWPHILVAIDDYDVLAGKVECERHDLASCLADGEELGISVLIAGNIAELPRDFDDQLMQRVRKHGCGILLSGSDGIEQFNNCRRIPGQPGAGLPAGRGFFIRRGRPRLFQAAAYWTEGQEPEEALANRLG